MGRTNAVEIGKMFHQIYLADQFSILIHSGLIKAISFDCCKHVGYKTDLVRNQFRKLEMNTRSQLSLKFTPKAGGDPALLFP